ncbi:MAG: hypothetical protein Q4E22_05830 [Coriobacteriia bacterium]|nr:hypothetical protein [Coriobacteriia bacterium]
MATYVEYLGTTEKFSFDDGVAYCLVGIEGHGLEGQEIYRVYSTNDDAYKYNSYDFRIIPPEELKNFKIDATKTYRDLYELDFRESSEGLTKEEARGFYISRLSATGQLPWTIRD